MESAFHINHSARSAISLRADNIRRPFCYDQAAHNKRKNLSYKIMHSQSIRCKCITRNSTGDEIANVNFLYDDIVHALENAMDSCINSATDRFLQHRFTTFSEIAQCNGHYAVQGHSRFWYQSKAHTTSY